MLEELSLGHPNFILETLFLHLNSNIHSQNVALLLCPKWPPISFICFFTIKSKCATSKNNTAS